MKQYCLCARALQELENGDQASIVPYFVDSLAIFKENNIIKGRKGDKYSPLWNKVNNRPLI